MILSNDDKMKSMEFTVKVVETMTPSFDSRADLTANAIEVIYKKITALLLESK